MHTCDGTCNGDYFPRTVTSGLTARPSGRPPPPPCSHYPRGYLHQLDVLSAELVLGQALSVHNPRVLQDLHGRQALVGVHVEHFGYHVLSEKVRGREEGA